MKWALGIGVLAAKAGAFNMGMPPTTSRSPHQVAAPAPPARWAQRESRRVSSAEASSRHGRCDKLADRSLVREQNPDYLAHASLEVCVQYSTRRR